jgi:hypothetical protein
VSAETPTTDRDDTEALAAVVLAVLPNRCCEPGHACPYDAHDADRLANAILASDWLAAYLARQVEVVGRERDVANGALDIAPEVLRLAEMSDQIGAWRKRAEQAERERDEARGESPQGFWSQREWEDWSNELAALIPDDDVRGNPEGAQESIILDTLRGWHEELTEARAAIERVTALAASLRRPLGGSGPFGAGSPEQRGCDYAADRLDATIAEPTEPASDRPLTVDEHLAEIERRIGLRACITGTDRHLDIVRDYREKVRRG